MKKKDNKKGLRIILAITSLVFIFIVIFVVIRLEGEKPVFEFQPNNVIFGTQTQVTLLVGDKKSGLKKVWVALKTEGKEIPLLEKDYEGSFINGGSGVHDDVLTLTFEPGKIGINDGTAVIRIAVTDYSWKGFLKGNVAYAEKGIVVDTKKPVINVLSKNHYISPGGTALAIYTLSEKCSKHGVVVDGELFPGHSGYFKDKNKYISFFALGHAKGKNTPIHLKAVDVAGNDAKIGFNYYVKRKRFKKDVINLPLSFLNRKLPSFDVEVPESSGDKKIAKFVLINNKLRKENYLTFVSVTKTTDEILHWKGRFERLPKSARRASFADHREYRYKGKKIDEQFHMGIDLASNSNSPIPAGNSGRIALAGDVGIYGRTVVIDHGFGLFSMYAHMSSVMVKQGDIVKKGDVIGKTGSTGLAGGDHLHYSMIVHDTFVNPVEWWDAKWIKNNVTSKLNAYKE